MNTCECFTESFSDYVDNTVPPEQKHRLDAHLSECPSCRATVGRLQNLRMRMHALPRLKASPDFETILRTRIMLERKKTHILPQTARMMRTSRAAVYAFAGLALVLTLGALLRDGRETETMTKREAPYVSSFYQPVPDSSLQTAKVSYPLDQILPAYLHKSRRDRTAGRGSSVSDSTPAPRVFSTGTQIRTASF